MHFHHSFSSPVITCEYSERYSRNISKMMPKLKVINEKQDYICPFDFFAVPSLPYHPTNGSHRQSPCLIVERGYEKDRKAYEIKYVCQETILCSAVLTSTFSERTSSAILGTCP
jgi:hypothetical protein